MQIIQEYVKGVRRFDSLRVFVKHAYELYDAMIAFIQIVYTFHIKYSIHQVLISFMGWRSRDHDGRGAKTSKGFKEGAGLQTIDPEIHSRRGRSSQGPYPPALSDLP